MTQQLKTRVKKEAGKCTSHSHADARLVELIKYLARHAAERDYNEHHSTKATQKDSLKATGEDS